MMMKGCDSVVEAHDSHIDAYLGHETDIARLAALRVEPFFRSVRDERMSEEQVADSDPIERAELVHRLGEEELLLR